MRKKLESLQYTVSAALFDTSDFGPPQSRHRAWVIASRCCLTESAILEASYLRTESAPLSSCILDKVPVPKPLRVQRKAQKEDPKWHKGYEECCDALGKAGGVLFSVLSPGIAVSFQAKVERIRKKLSCRVAEVGLSDREVAILATAICDMQARGVDPMLDSTVIQVEAW